MPRPAGPAAFAELQTPARLVLPALVPPFLAAYPEIWAAGGTPHTVFPLTFDDLVRLTGGTVLKVD